MTVSIYPQIRGGNNKNESVALKSSSLFFVARSIFNYLLDHVINFDYIKDMKSTELKRWLAKQGATFEPAKGSHFKVYLNGKQSVIPMHNKELPTGTVEGIKKQLGLK
jgi:mRNA interferase HicA